MMATSMPYSAALRAATGSKGVERPGLHSVGINPINSSHRMSSSRVAEKSVRGSDV